MRDGGVVALITAIKRPDLVDRLVLVGCNFHHDGLDPRLFALLHPRTPAWELLAAGYAELSPDGADHFATVAEKSLVMFRSEPTMAPDDLSQIQAPTLVMVGDDDAINHSHTVALYEALPNGQLCIVPGASHFLPVEQPARTLAIIMRFLTSTVPPQTLFPVRRA